MALDVLEFPPHLEQFQSDFDDSQGECEDCGTLAPEWRLDQCQYGFCGRYCCRGCGFRCERCRDFNPRSVCLCDFHAKIAYPQCSRCNRRFCDECTNVTVKKCTSCLDHICTCCLGREDLQSFTSKSQLCKNCHTKMMRPLQELCRTSIRRSLRASLVSEEEELHPKEIDKNVKHLPLPTLVKNFMCFE